MGTNLHNIRFPVSLTIDSKRRFKEKKYATDFDTRFSSFGSVYFYYLFFFIKFLLALALALTLLFSHSFIDSGTNTTN